MDKVINSVQQILSECESMLTQVSDTEYMDIKCLAKTVQEQCEKLKALHTESPEKEREIAAQKVMVESAAIRLEYFMSIRLDMYTDRKKLRKYAEKVYIDCRDRAMKEAASTQSGPATIGAWGERTKWALGFYARSKHILFEADEHDENMLKDITVALA